MFRKILMMAVALVGVFAFSAAQARDTTHYYPIEDVIQAGIAQGKLSPNIRFYFGTRHPPVAAKLAPEVVSNKKTNAFNKTSAHACQIAALDALISFEDRVKHEGGNAVVDLVSYYKKNVYSSPDKYECHDGTFVTGVAFRGDVVKMK
jgi:hypothetical protein